MTEEQQEQPAEIPDPARVGDHVTWLDRLGILRAGRVHSLVPGEGGRELAQVQVANGSVALVAVDNLRVHQRESDDDRAADRQRARDWLDRQLATQVEDAVTRAWHALRELEPDKPEQQHRLAAADLVIAAATSLRERLDVHLSAPTEGKP